VIDNQEIVRNCLRAVLVVEPLWQVVGEAANGQELLGQLPTVPVDVVLIDLSMPVLDGQALRVKQAQQLVA